MLSRLLKRNWQGFAKFCKTPQEAIEGIKDGSLLITGGFGITGVPMNLFNAIKESKVKDLVCGAINLGFADKEGKMDWGIAILLRSQQIKKVITSYGGDDFQFQRQYFNGSLEFDVTPQGTLIQMFRAGGAGIPAFYTHTGVGTIIQTGGFVTKYKYNGDYEGVRDGRVKLEPEKFSAPRPTAVFNGKKYLQYEALYGDFALVKAKRADRWGNLQFEKTQRNINPDVARAAGCVIAQVEEIVQTPIDPEHVQVPGVYVNRILLEDPNSKYSQIKIQKLTILGEQQVKWFVGENDLRAGKIIFDHTHLIENQIRNKNADKNRLKIAKRASKLLKDGMFVNLGVGIPTMVPSFIPKNIQIHLESENGVMGLGPYPTLETATGKITNAGKETTTLNVGGSYFSSSESFNIIRGGHLDMTMLGAFEVSQVCDVANWMVPGKTIRGMGGAMDLANSGSDVVILMEHCSRSKTGEVTQRLVKNCTYPLTAKGTVSKVITELAVFENVNGRLVLRQIAEQTTLQEVQKLTGFELVIQGELGRF